LYNYANNRINPEAYRQRDELLAKMGYESYRHYLGSSLWAKIRKDLLVVERLVSAMPSRDRIQSHAKEEFG
jgi:hypothetical protein